MTLEAIKREIGKKLGDPDLRTYRGVVKDAFTDAIVSLLNAEEYTEEEIFSLIVRTANTATTSDQSLPDDATVVIKILNVFGGGTNQLIRKTPEEIDRIKTDSELSAMTNEQYYYLVGNKIYYEPVDADVSVVVKYIKEPEFDGWDDTTTVDSYYRLTFIKRATMLAVSMLGGGGQKRENRAAAPAA
tara:strand:- start:36 stop:596 length:561 start_codon:yes stop_codon:yes gene_type:complete